MKDDILEIEVSNEEIGQRIDKYLSMNIEDLTRSYIEKLIDDKKVLVNGKAVKSSYKVQSEDCIKVIVPAPVDGSE